MLPKSPKEITEAILQEACRERWPESQTLDFKRELPALDSDGRSDFLKDVCAFANADGGDLVYGVADHGGAASKPMPIRGESLDAVRRRLTQILDGRIEPRVNGILIEPVEFAEGGFAWIIRVPASFDTPHRYKQDEHHTRFVVRNGTLASDMTYDQIRTAFDRSATLAERARLFRAERITAIAAGRGWRVFAPGPIAVVHMLPLAAMSGRSSVDVGALHDGDYMAFAQKDPSWGSMTTRTLNLDGLVIHPEGPDQVVQAYAQVFRTGCLESVRNVAHVRMGPGIIPSTALATFIRSTIQSLSRGAVKHGLVGPGVVGVSLLRVENVRLGLGDRYSQTTAAVADRYNLVLPETWVDELSTFIDVDPAVRQLLDMLWQCFDEPKCLEYTPEGVWRPQ